MSAFILKLLGAALLAVLIKGGVALAHHSIAWWAAGLIALVVVYGGFLIIDNSDGDWWS